VVKSDSRFQIPNSREFQTQALAIPDCLFYANEFQALDRMDTREDNARPLATSQGKDRSNEPRQRPQQPAKAKTAQPAKAARLKNRQDFWNLGFGIWNLEFGIGGKESLITDLKVLKLTDGISVF
jgi:hypothetical protein